MLAASAPRPTVVEELADAVQAAYLANGPAAIAILDAGCRTGLVGVQLKRLGFHLLDGFDLSEEDMVGKALKSRVSSHVRKRVDPASSRSGTAQRTHARTGSRHAPQRIHHRKHSQELCGG